MKSQILTEHFEVEYLQKSAAVLCSSTGYTLGGVNRCIFVTGKPHRALHWCMDTWHGAWHFGLPYLFGGYLSL